MVDRPGRGPEGLSGRASVVTEDRIARRVRISWTLFGVVVTVGVIGVALWRPAVADPSVMGLVWAGLAAVFVLGLVLPALSLRMLRIEVTDAPTDLVVGQLSGVAVQLRGRVSGLMARCGRSPMFLVDITSPDDVRLPLEVARRGAYDHLPVEVLTDAPFSIVIASTRRTIPLPHQLLVGPVAEPTTAQLGTLGGDRSDVSGPGRAVTGDTVRSVRPYVVGDPAHMVHWPSSARLGSLVVRELEPPRRLGVAIMVQLDGEPGEPEVEAAVSRAAGVALDALARDGRVVLCTATPTGPVAGEVSSELAVRRRLAVAVSGPLPAAPDGWPIQVISGGGST